MQNVSIDCSDDDGSSDTEIDPVINAAVACAMVVESDDSITEESDSDDEFDGQVTNSVLQDGSGLIQGSDGSRWQKIAVSSTAQGRL